MALSCLQIQRPDADDGDGVANLGRAMNRNNPLHVDTASSSLYYDAATGQMEFAMQNRSGQGDGGMVLSVDAGGAIDQGLANNRKTSALAPPTP